MTLFSRGLFKKTSLHKQEADDHTDCQTLPKSKADKRDIGDQYELLASNYLANQGLTLLEANFLTKLGEIDLVMLEGQTIVFVEVKYRKNNLFGDAAEFVNRNKANKLIKAAYIWLKKNRYNAHSTEFRFDVVAIQNQGKSFNWIKNAVCQE